MNVEELALHICRQLEHSPEVEIDGLGKFARNAQGIISFHENKRPEIFISYAIEDSAMTERLYADLQGRGYTAWMDRTRLLPGQNWPRRIQNAIEQADFFIACFSSRSANKRGTFQAEIRYALECARRIPLDDVFFIPARLDSCRVPSRIEQEIQFVDLFPVWEMGMAKIVGIIERQRRLVRDRCKG